MTALFSFHCGDGARDKDKDLIDIFIAAPETQASPT